MKSAKDKPKNNPESQLIDSVLYAIWQLIIMAGVASIVFIQRNDQRLERYSFRQLVLLFLPPLVLGILLLTYTARFYSKNTFEFWLFHLMGIWFASIAVVFLTYRVWYRNMDPTRITTRLLDKRAEHFERLIPFLDDPQTIPIGISLSKNEPFFVPRKQSEEHMLFCGATGMGKTSVLITQLMHSMRHNLPAIVVDPKGDLVDVGLIKEIAKMMGRLDDLLIFSISSPHTSCSYNFLKVGTPEQKKSKLKLGMDLEHHHYGALAASFLGTIFDIIDYLGEIDGKKKSIEIIDLQRLLLNEDERGRLEDRLNNEPESPQIDDFLSKLNAIRKLRPDDMSGLTAQVEAFSLREFAGIFTPSRSQNPEIDLVEALQKGKIVYFQLNTNAYADIAQRFGKILVQDLSLISNLFQNGQLTREFEHAGIHIDEFGSFVNKNFANIQKMIRSAHMGLRLYYQGMADLREISPQFEDQVLGNAATKIILRQDIQNDVEKWSGMAGTVDAYIRSFQTEDSTVGTIKTGMGNLHEGKKVKIEFDVFKELQKGQAVVIDKSRKIQDLIEIWDSKNPTYLNQITDYLQTKINNAQLKIATSVNKGASRIESLGNNLLPEKPKRHLKRGNREITSGRSSILNLSDQ